MPQLFSNAAKSTLQALITDVDRSLTLTGNGAAFPVANQNTGSSGDWFKAVLDDGTNQEVIRVRTHTSGSTGFSNILRGQESTQARTWPAGTTIGLRLTAEDFTLITGRMTVASVADMKAVAAPVGSTIETLGYYTPGDGGCATYRIVAAGTGTQDGGSLITLNNTLQAQALFPGNVVRLSQFGAKGVYEAPRTAPDSLGSWTDLGNGSYRLQWDGVSAVTPMTFNTVAGNGYFLSFSRESALGGIGTYDICLYQANGTTEIGKAGRWFVPQRLPALAAGTAVAAGSTMVLKPVNGSSTPLDVTIGDLQFVRSENDVSALNAALAWFSTTRTGKLVVDAASYLYTATAISIPENVDLEFAPKGTLNSAVAVTVNSQVFAGNRAILPRYSSVTFGPRQTTVNPNWFGL